MKSEEKKSKRRRLFGRMKDRKGMTLAELVIAMTLMSSVMLGCVAIINLTSKTFVSADNEITTTRQDAKFVHDVNEAVRESTAVFTIPKESFVKEKLTKGWDYIGLMQNVHIPQAASTRGQEMDSAEALVYIEYVGETAPSGIPRDSNLLENKGSYFIQHIMGHSYTDMLGYDHDYDLVFTPIEADKRAAKTIRYDFDAAIKDKDGNLVGGEENGIDVDTMLESLNSVQVVYQGSEFNPAVAIAFTKDYMPGFLRTKSTETAKLAETTVVFVLDYSNSMGGRINAGSGGTTDVTAKIDALRENMHTFLEKHKDYDNLNIIIVPFSTYAASICDFYFYLEDLEYPVLHIGDFTEGLEMFSAGTYGMEIPCAFNAKADFDIMDDLIDALTYHGGTNLGDGLRVAYHQLQDLKNAGYAGGGATHLVIMSDGGSDEMTNQNNTYCTARIYPWEDMRPKFDISGGGSRTRTSDKLYGYKYYEEKICEYGLGLDVDEYIPLVCRELWAKEPNLTTTVINLGGSQGWQSRMFQDTLDVDPSNIFDVVTETEFTAAFESIGMDVEADLCAYLGPEL